MSVGPPDLSEYARLVYSRSYRLSSAAALLRATRLSEEKLQLVSEHFAWMP